MNVKPLLLFALFSVFNSQAIEHSNKVKEGSYKVECFRNETGIREEIINPHNNDTISIDVKILPNFPHKC